MPKERISKIIAHSGLASRRAAEALITDGRVTVNGKCIREQGHKADPEADKICVDGKRIKTEENYVYIALNKPRGYLVTKSDEKNRKTILDLIPKKYHHVHPVGRLDKETSGLLILTNDGNFTLKVTHPRYGIRKKYRVSLKGRLAKKDIALLEEGFDHPEFYVSPCYVENFEYNSKEKKTRFLLNIGEGKKREIRKIFEYLDYELLRLHRLQLGAYKMKLAMGEYRIMTKTEVDKVLRNEPINQ